MARTVQQRRQAQIKKANRDIIDDAKRETPPSPTNEGVTLKDVSVDQQQTNTF